MAVWGNRVVAHIVDWNGKNSLKQKQVLRVENMLLAVLQGSGGLVLFLNPRHIWEHNLTAFAPHDSHETRNGTPVMSSKFRSAIITNQNASSASKYAYNFPSLISSDLP
jgi:hypothetical protein